MLSGVWRPLLVVQPGFDTTTSCSAVNVLLTELIRRLLVLANNICLHEQEWQLTNQSQFSIVYTVIDHRNDVIKCWKLKWNNELQASSFTAKFWTFYGIISMVYKSVDHGKLWWICFFTVTFIFSFLWNFLENLARTAWHVTSFPWSILS